MDMREFRKAKFLKVENCRVPRQMRIAGAALGKYGKPDLIFENGDRLGLSATNAEILSDAYGWESEAWAGHLVELYVGQGQFEGETVDMVLIDSPQQQNRRCGRHQTNRHKPKSTSGKNPAATRWTMRSHSNKQTHGEILMLGNLHLMESDPKLEARIRSTVAGMAHWAGPASNRKCGECALWSDELNRKTARRCEKFSQLMGGTRGPHIPCDTKACKYFSPEGGQRG